jgi:hypothetical protein
MSLLDLLKSEAINRGLLELDAALDAGRVFSLVRDMPYQRASDRGPETTIAEWRGTCSGKHYLLQMLFEELDLPSTLIACSSITPVDPDDVEPAMQQLYQAANRRFVDVHNYLIVTVPDSSEMVVDATWPLSTKKNGMVVNEDFILGQDQKLATNPIETWVVPPGSDAQEFKDQLLKEHFTPAELQFREVVIEELSKSTQRI